MMPMVSATIVSTGSMATVARTRGTTSFLIGSVPSARMALICSVTSIEPNSDAIPEPTRPATIKAASTGPEFADQRYGNQSAGEADGAEAGKASFDVCKRQNGAGEKARQHNDGERSDADEVHLHQDVAHVKGAPEHGGESLAGQEGSGPVLP